MLLTPRPQSTCAQPSSYLRLTPEASYLDGFYAFAYWYCQHCPQSFEEVVIPGAQGASRSAIDAHKNRGLDVFAKNTKRARTALIRNDHRAAPVMRVEASSLWHVHGFGATAEAVKHGPLREEYKRGLRVRQISYA